MIRSRVAGLSAGVLCGLFFLAGCQASKPQDQPLDALMVNRAIMVLEAGTTSKDPVVRANCIEALQLARDPRAQTAIEAGLHDPEPMVRFAAAMAAGKRKAQEVAPTLRAMLATDRDMSVRVACVYGLARMGDPSHMNLLAAALEDQPDPSARANAAMVLGFLEDPSAIPLLNAHREDRDVRVRTEIKSAMARLGDQGACEVIAAWAVSRNPDVQWNAMMVCGDLPESVGASALLLGLQDTPATPAADSQVTTVQAVDMTVQRQLVAARSLAKLGSLQGDGVALKNLANPNPALRSLAYLALGEMLAPPGAGRLAPGLTDPDEGVERAAAAALVNVAVRAARGS